MAYMDKYNNFSKTSSQISEESAIIDAYNMSLKDYTKSDITDILSKNDDEIKPIALINLKSIENKYEADLVLGHLTGQDGRIREAVSYVLKEFCPDKYYSDENSKKIITEGLLDINPNVVRNVISFIEKSETLKRELSPMVISKTRDVLSSLSIYIKESSPFVSNQTKSSKNHAKNKLTFNLYWLLETISILEYDEDIEDILTKTGRFLDYTIREKTALILSKMENPPVQLLRELKNDENIYVKNQLL